MLLLVTAKVKPFILVKDLILWEDELCIQLCLLLLVAMKPFISVTDLWENKLCIEVCLLLLVSVT